MSFKKNFMNGSGQAAGYWLTRTAIIVAGTIFVKDYYDGTLEKRVKKAKLFTKTVIDTAKDKVHDYREKHKKGKYIIVVQEKDI